MSTVLEEVKAERERQDAKWGGPGHDDQHNPQAWFDLISNYLEQAAQVAYAPHGTFDHTGEPWRRRLIQVAALAIAAVESADRQQPAPPPDAGQCWSCAGSVGNGYRVRVALVPGDHDVLNSYWCWPCFKRVNDAFGEQARLAEAQAASAGSTA